MIDLLGLDLYNLFIADLDAQGVPLSVRFIAIYDSFVIDDNCHRCRSRNMKHMLVGITFFHVQRDQPVKATTTGPKRKKGANSENMDNSSFDIFTRYNNSVDDYASFALGSGHTARGWLPLDVGSIPCTVTTTGDGSVSVRHYNQWP